MLCLMCVLTAGTAPAVAVAQASGTTRVVGRVVSQTGAPVAAAEVGVESTFRRTTSGATGHFAIALPHGEWTLAVRRIGHAPATLRIDTQARGEGDTLLVTLADAPAALRGIVVRGARSPAMSETITAENARQAPPLGEADVFRMLPLLPAVSQPNDLLGRFHLAGGASDEHGVTLDGHPLQSPFHAHSLLGAFNVAALERADVMIHHLPAAGDGYLSGLVKLESRRAGGRAPRELVTSLLSTSLTATQPSIVKGIDLLASGRATYIDRFLREYARQRGDADDDLNVPGYRDALVRIGGTFAGRLETDLLGYITRDSWHEREEFDADEPLAWGESLVGFRSAVAVGGMTATLRASSSEAWVEYRRRHSSAGEPWYGEWVDVRQRWMSGEVALERDAHRWRARGGMAYDSRSHRHDWRTARSEDLFSESVPGWYERDSQQAIVRAFGEAAFLLLPAVEIEGGLQLSTLGGRTHAAPRLLVTGRVTPHTRLDVAIGRRYQFDAIAGEPEEGSITQPVFLLSVPRSVTTGALSLAWETATRDDAWSLNAVSTLFARSYRDRTMPAAPPIAVDASSTVMPELLFSRGSAHTRGGSISATLAKSDGANLQASYTWQRARQAVEGGSQPVPWDAPHNAGIFASVPAWRRWTATTAFQYRSGPAATPVAGRIIGPSPGRSFGSRVIPGEPFSVRHPPYTRLDLALRKTWRPASAEWTLAIQALNILWRENVRRVSGSYADPCPPRAGCAATPGSRGLPLIPSIGVEVRW